MVKYFVGWFLKLTLFLVFIGSTGIFIVTAIRNYQSARLGELAGIIAISGFVIVFIKINKVQKERNGPIRG